MTRFTFKGWEFKKWVQANKGNLRLIISCVLGIVSSWIAGYDNIPLSASVGGVVTAVSKLILDSFDYYVSK